MKTPETPQPQNPEPEVTRETDERVANEAYIKAFDTVKTLFDASLQIDKKMSAGIKQVHAFWVLYLGFCSTLVAIISFFGAKQFIRTETEKQIKQFTDTKVSNMIVASVSDAEARVKTDFTQYMDDQVKSFEHRTEELDGRIKEAEDLINVYEKCASARAWNRGDYEFLVELSGGTGRVAHVASSTVEEIRKSFEQRKNSVFAIRPILGYSENRNKKVPEDEMILAIYQDSVGQSDGAINSLVDKNEKKYVAILIHAIKSSQHLDFVYAAIRGVERLTGESFPALGIQEALNWWKTNEENPIFHCTYERYAEAKQLPNESMDDYIWRKIDLLLDWIGEKPNQYPSAELLAPMLLFAKGNEEKDQTRQASLEKVFDYWATENPKAENWYIFKAVYLARYSPDKLIAFVNERLKEHPAFEDELKRWTFYFPPEFFEIPAVHWPSKNIDKPQVEKDAEQE